MFRQPNQIPMRQYVFILIIFTSGLLYAQKDTLFWFAVPEVDNTHADRPIILRLTSFEENTQVRISTPLSSSSLDSSITLNEDEFRSIDLTAFIDHLECKYNDSILNNGLLIESNKPIRALYDLVSVDPKNNRPSNSDFFNLKGNEALGLDFYLPFQFKSKKVTKVPTAQTSFDIVATEDNTSITITPTSALVNHPANIPFQITLNRGQTYSGVMLELDTYLTGTQIHSDKPIAVTLKDDSVVQGSGYDLLGDQLIPKEHSGQEFIVQGGRIIFVAQENNTTLKIADEPGIPLQEGEFISIEFDEWARYVSSSKPIAALHVKAMNKGQTEVAAAALNGVTCNGAMSYHFFKYNAYDQFTIIIITKKDAQDNFKINGIPLDSTYQFTEVEGSSDFVYLEIVNHEALLSNAMNTISNSNTKFDLGIGIGGYQSQYAFLSDRITEIFEEDTIQLCDTLVNILEAPFGFDNYKWKNGTTGRILNIEKGINTYYLEASDGRIKTCRYTDSITVNVLPSPTFTLQENFSLCEDDTVLIGITSTENIDYEWNDGQVSSEIKIFEGGNYVLTTTNENGCRYADSVEITQIRFPKLSLPNDTVLCQEDALVITFDSSETRYKWSDIGISNERTISEEGIYSVKAYTETETKLCGDTLYASINVEFWEVEVYNLLTANGDNANDQFIVTGLDQGIWNFNVYNRWGQVVYQNEKYDNSWQGENLKPGIYFYELSEAAHCNTFTGWVHLIK